MRRREFIALVGGSVAAWPIRARAQQTSLPVIGFLNAVARETVERFVTGFRSGLAEASFVEGRNVAIEFRWADGHYDRLPALAAELVRRKVAVIVAGGGPPSAMAAKAATATIPIVFTAVAEPVEGGLVASLNRPGANVTGVTVQTTALDSKRLELLSEVAPAALAIGALVNPRRPDAAAQVKSARATAAALGRHLAVLNASNEAEIDEAFVGFGARRIGALLVMADPYFTSRREQIVALSERHQVPAMYQWREFAAAGGLMSYGPSITDAYRQAGAYTGRILKGEKPGDLPVLQPTKFEFVINLRTAKALGLTVPEPLQARADELLE
jgi:putative ABC transport system substrate-binding protein